MLKGISEVVVLRRHDNHEIQSRDTVGQRRVKNAIAERTVGDGDGSSIQLCTV